MLEVVKQNFEQQHEVLKSSILHVQQIDMVLFGEVVQQTRSCLSTIQEELKSSVENHGVYNTKH